MKKRKLTCLLLCSLMLLSSLGGCGKDDTAKTDTQPATSEKAEEKIEYNGVFNSEVFEKICNDINLYGKDISLPCSMEDLGEEFSAEYLLISKKSSIVTYDLNYKDSLIGFVLFHSNEKLSEQDLKTKDFNTINLEMSDEVKIAGLKNGDNVEIIKQLFGEPTKILGNEESGSYIYNVDEDAYIKFYLNCNKIDDVSINLQD